MSVNVTGRNGIRLPRGKAFLGIDRTVAVTVTHVHADHAGESFISI